jgi:hypothetical protein
VKAKQLKNAEEPVKKREQKAEDKVVNQNFLYASQIIIMNGKGHEEAQLKRLQQRVRAPIFKIEKIQR